MTNKEPYKISIGGIKLRLIKLQAHDQQVREIKAETIMKEGLANINEMLHILGLPYIFEIICVELIGQYHENPLAGYLGIEKTR